ncbi:MAG: oxidoreductase-like domain-containing protein [Caulobacter sp.]
MTPPARPPAPPEKPEPEMCCNRGCCPCIFDYYWDALERWKARVSELGLDPEALLAAGPAST